MQSERQRKIMEHLTRSKGEFISPKLESSTRKQQIMDHVRLSKG
jgi:hypothetical protein